MTTYARVTVDFGSLVRKYDEEILFDEDFGNHLDLNLIENFALLLANLFSAVFMFQEKMDGKIRERKLIL